MTQSINEVSRELGRLDGRLDAVDERLDRAMKRLTVVEGVAKAETPGEGSLSKQERLVLLGGAPVVIAAVIAALVEILRLLAT